MEDRQKEDVAIKRRFIRWMEDNRGLILTVIGLPASFIFDLIMRVSKSILSFFSLLKNNPSFDVFEDPKLVARDILFFSSETRRKSEENPSSSPPMEQYTRRKWKAFYVHSKTQLVVTIHHFFQQRSLSQSSGTTLWYSRVKWRKNDGESGTDGISGRHHQILDSQRLHSGSHFGNCRCNLGRTCHGSRHDNILTQSKKR